MKARSNTCKEILQAGGIVVVMLGASIAGTTQIYTSVYDDITMRLFGGTLACGKANWFLAG